MGPNALWLMEALTEHLTIEPGMRVLDLGCGKAVTSIFLAREFGAEVWAVDLWIDATSNLARIEAAGTADRVFPIHAEGHDLPFAHGFFDAVLSVDAYHYFGTDDLYLDYITRFLGDRGRIGMVAPALFTEFGEDLPEHLEPFRGLPFHGPEWWHSHWAKSGRVSVELADRIPGGWRDWLRWLDIAGPRLTDEAVQRTWAEEAALLRRDQGEHVGFTRIVATKAAP